MFIVVVLEKVAASEDFGLWWCRNNCVRDGCIALLRHHACTNIVVVIVVVVVVVVAVAFVGGGGVVVVVVVVVVSRRYIEAWSAEHIGLQVIPGLLGIIVYVVGVPLFVSVQLHRLRARHLLSDDDTLQQFQWLYGACRALR